MKTRYALALLGAMTLAGCSRPEPSDLPLPAGDLFSAIAAHCGEAYSGEVLGEDPRDADWIGQRIVMHVRACTDEEIRIPLHVGEDRSRTWVLTRQGDGLRLKHDHRHEDGSEDVLTQYGGDTIERPGPTHAEFPADAFSRDLFQREGIPVSMDNVWSMTLTDTTFTYALVRPDRNFRIVFDLTEPVTPPPPPWGAED